MSTNDNCSLLVTMPHGSHLYGTAGPESDIDIKGVYVPSIQSLLRGRAARMVTTKPKKQSGVKNSPGDIDRTFFSIHEFLRLALEGQTVAIDMLFASPRMWVSRSEEWETLIVNRHRFMTRNLGAFIGYAKRQAAKYGMKGSRIQTARFMVEQLCQYQSNRVKDVAVEISLAAIREEVDHFCRDMDTGEIEVLGKRLTPGATCEHYVVTFQRYLESYGERAKMAETNEGVDWKAMMHAIRAAIMIEHILTGASLSLPFDQGTADYLRGIKLGRYDFSVVLKDLEERIDLCEGFAARSTLPLEPDYVWAGEWLDSVIKRSLRSSIRGDAYTGDCGSAHSTVLELTEYPDDWMRSETVLNREKGNQ